VTGILTVSPAIISINAPRAGRVEKIHGAVGDSISRNQVLIEINPEPVLSAGRSSAEAQIQSLLKTADELKLNMEQLTQKKRLFAQEHEARQTYLRRLLASATVAHEIQLNGLAIARTLFDEKKRLALRNSGRVPPSELQQLEQNLTIQQTAVNAAQTDIQKTEEELRKSEAEFLQHANEHGLTSSQLRQKQLETERLVEQARNAASYQIASTETAVVDSIFVAEGQRVTENAKLLGLTSSNAVFEAELYVPSRAAAFIAVGQSVRMALDAYPYQHFGFINGRINRVSSVLLRPDEVPAPVPLQEPSYRILVALEKQSLRTGGEEFALKSGLQLSADIILERKTLAEWIAQAVSKVWSRM
jgi:membrane fusion protein